MAHRPAAGEGAYTRRFTVSGPGFHVEFDETFEEQPPYPTASSSGVREPSPVASSRARVARRAPTAPSTLSEAAPPSLPETERFYLAEPTFPQTKVKYGPRRFYVVIESTSCRHLEGIWLCQWVHLQDHLPHKNLKKCLDITLKGFDDVEEALAEWSRLCPDRAAVRRA